MIPYAEIQQALHVVREQVDPTPLMYSEHFSRLAGAHIYLKLENLQRTGSFKVRGALYKLHRCRNAIGGRGVVAASAGNHAQGVALAATSLGLRSTIVMPECAPLSKQIATRQYGGRVILHGRTVADALEKARELERHGSFFVHPFDDNEVITGQGTVGLEILEQTDPPDEVWVPVGGGGLIAGVASALKAEFPRTRLVGIQTEACPSAVEAMRQGRRVRVTPDQSIADGILVPEVGEITFPLLAEGVDEMVSVDENQIAMAIVQLLEKKKLLAEGAGVVPLAALLSAAPERVRERRIVLVISGGNVDLNVLDRILERGLMRTGRILRFRVVLDDVPGALAALLRVVSEEGANVLNIAHDRLAPDLPLGRTRVEIGAETRGFDHIEELTAALEAAGFRSEPVG